MFADERARARRLLAQEKKGRNQRYSLQAPEVECIRKGKAHRRYEFGVKGSMAIGGGSSVRCGFLVARFWGLVAAFATF